jgi:DNA-binding CsgD family transcriptional regulator
VPASQPIPQPLSHARALRGDDERARLMAHALDALTAVVPASAAAISPVDRRLAAFTTGPIVVRVDSRALAADVDRIHAAYLTRAGGDDPFEPRHWATRGMTAIGVGDVGGAPPPCDLLAAQRLSRRAAVFLRDRGRLVAYAVLMRELGAPDPTAPEIERLRRVQPLIEQALLLTRERPPESAAGADLLRVRGLTGREAEVAALAATGATNAEIARELYISVNTVKTHLGRALAKLGLRSRTELALAVSGRR